MFATSYLTDVAQLLEQCGISALNTQSANNEWAFTESARDVYTHSIESMKLHGYRLHAASLTDLVLVLDAPAPVPTPAPSATRRPLRRQWIMGRWARKRNARL